ncbi:MAG: lyase [Xanthobacteraceae bacterium]|nr:lyase [Xanthobacteraceae bacterium]
MIRPIEIAMAALATTAVAAADTRVSYFPVTSNSRPHDVAVAADGKVWYSGQRAGYLGLLDPKTGKDENIPIGSGSAPHGVIVAPDGAAWLTDGGLNANVRYDTKTKKFDYYPLPPHLPNANLNTGVFDKDGVYWFTGQNGVHGYVNPKTGKHESWKSPRRGTYGITVTPTNEIWYVALAGDHLGKIDKANGNVMVVEPHKKGAGPRRVWTDSKGLLWVSFWHSGEVGRYDPAAKAWKTWLLPGNPGSGCYSVYVDEKDQVWLTDFMTNAIVRFDPATEKFESFPSDKRGAQVRQMLGRPGEAWGAESGNDRLVQIKY